MGLLTKEERARLSAAFEHGTATREDEAELNAMIDRLTNNLSEREKVTPQHQTPPPQ